tara:strand:+ start:499 stop:753 length:255 start_codon:yes stop_codon:yes gene_type:complete
MEMFAIHAPNFFYTHDKVVTLDTNDIRLAFESDTVHLNRYYKDDWQGYIIKTYTTALFVATFDCRHPRNSLDKIFGRLREEFED